MFEMAYINLHEVVETLLKMFYNIVEQSGYNKCILVYNSLL